MRTVILKLHEPGAAKKAVLDEAMSNYRSALQFLIDHTNRHLEAFYEEYGAKGGPYNVLALSKWIGTELQRELNRYGVQPFKDALRLDFGMIAANALRRAEERTEAGVSAEVGAPSTDTEASSADSRALSADIRTPANKARALQPMACPASPAVYFCRYDTKRSCCLLYDSGKNRYYAKLYLLNGSNARKSQGPPANGGKLVHIHKEGSFLKRTARKEPYLLVPLSFGKWQEKLLAEAARAPERFKTARLYKRDGEYYLALSIETEPVPAVQPETYIGISRGLRSDLQYTVVNTEGTVLASGSVGDPVGQAAASGSGDGSECVSEKSAYRSIYKHISLAELHTVANQICEIAVRYKAHGVAEKLGGKGDRLCWTDASEDPCRPRYGWRNYNRLLDLLDYKLEWIGLPRTSRVSPVGIFYTCPRCGRNTKQNRLNRDIFICTGCGTTMEVERLGSLNLACKLLRYSASKVKIKYAGTDTGIRFTNPVLGLDFVSNHGENHQERLRQELLMIVESAAPQSRGKAGIIRKLKKVENFMDLIDYIE
jgi:putative transposase